jgi:hypothetical protein
MVFLFHHARTMSAVLYLIPCRRGGDGTAIAQKMRVIMILDARVVLGIMRSISSIGLPVKSVS